MSEFSLFQSIQFAVKGIATAWTMERNFRIHVVVSILITSLGVYCHLSVSEWALIGSAMILVLVAELINTAIEVTIDLVTRKRKFRAMLGKDIAAGAVFLTAIYAAFVGCLIFIPKLWVIFLGGC
jgi:diacylglycerol kinase